MIFKKPEPSAEIPMGNGINHPTPAGHPNGNFERAQWPPLPNVYAEHAQRAPNPIANNQMPHSRFPFRRPRPPLRPAVQPIREHDGRPEIGSGDVVAPRGPSQLVRMEELRELGELIRERYKLDMLLFNLQDKTAYEDDVIDETMVKSIAALAKIRRLVESFDRRDLFKTTEEHDKLREIKRRIHESGKRDWKKHPLSMDRERDRDFDGGSQSYSPMYLQPDDDFE
jgi:hypothetical protein